MRIGQGYDVHAFGEGDHITLGGIKIPHNKGFIAHSDGDVLIHAMCDALLGALALGDIGVHFPPSDEQWKDCASSVFLNQCHQLVQERGYEIGNIDCTLMAELPKIKPHSQSIRANLAHLLDLNINQISLKATTTEQLGFTGRKEGMAASVICLLKANPV